MFNVIIKYFVSEFVNIRTANTVDYQLQLGHVTDYNNLYYNEKRFFNNRYPCDQCNKVYTLKANLKRHRKVECGKQPSVRCSVCPYVTYYKSDLMKHFNKKHF